MRHVVLLACILILIAEAQGQPAPKLGIKHVAFTAKLLAPISTKESKEGDMFTALVEEPSQYSGAILEGSITRLRKARKVGKNAKSELAFHVESMTWEGTTVPVTVDLTDVANSKGVRNVDEEGHVIGKSSNAKRQAGAALGSLAGAVIGGALAGSSGALIGAAAGAGLGLVIAVGFTSANEDIDLQPGSRLTLDVSDREEAPERAQRRSAR